MAIITNIKNRLNQLIYPRTLAEAVKYDNDTSGLNADDVQGAIDEINGVIDDMVTYYSSTVTTTWAGSGPYTQDLTISGIKATDRPEFDIDFSGVPYADVDDVLDAWGDIYRWVTSENKVTVYARAETTISVPLAIKVVR